jgi:hypothetical protein
VDVNHARSSTRRRISRQRSRHVVETTSVIFRESAPKDSPLRAPRLVFLSPDEQGKLLEVMAIQTDTGDLRVIHAQPIRNRYIELQEGGL